MLDVKIKVMDIVVVVFFPILVLAFNVNERVN
jgi:hypothetical protein